MATFPSLVEPLYPRAPSLEAVLNGTYRVLQVTRSDTRFRVLMKGPCRAPASRLSRREQTVVRRLVLGHCQKLVAFDFGLAHTTVSSHLRSSLDKMGLRRWEVAVLVAAVVESSPTLSDVTSEESLLVGPLASEETAVALERDMEGGVLSSLTEAEREVALRIVQGCTNAEIGSERNSSPRTVANQVSSVFRKLDVHGRCELIRLLVVGREPAPLHTVPPAEEAPLSGPGKLGARQSGDVRGSRDADECPASALA